MILDTIILNVNMGLGLIDENLDGLMDYFKEVPLAFNLVGMAKAIGLAIAIGVASYEAYMMMLGKRGVDVMKILRILILAICISSSGWIAKALQTPGEELMTEARAAHHQAYQNVLAKEYVVSLQQEAYVRKLKTAVDSVRSKERIAELTDWSSIDIASGLVTKINEIALGELNALGKKGAAATEAFICEWIQFLIRFIGEVIFQMIYYALLVTQRVALYVMTLFMPVAFALSLAPPYKSAWSQYISKFLSVSLWGFVIYVMMFFVDNVLYYFIDLDSQSYQNLLQQSMGGGWDDIATLGIQGVGSTCMYVVAMLIGAKVLSMAPEMAGWLIPGGVSSGSGGMAAGAAIGAAAGAVSMAAGVAGAGAGVVMKAPNAIGGATAAGMAVSNNNNATVGQAVAHGILSQTSFGKTADQSSHTSQPFIEFGHKPSKGSAPLNGN